MQFSKAVSYFVDFMLLVTVKIYLSHAFYIYFLAHLSHMLLCHQSSICFKHHLLKHLVDCHQTSQNDPWVVPFQSCSTNSIPCRILVDMATKRKNFKNLVKNYWSDFKIIWYKWSLGGPLPKLFKTWLPGGVSSFSYVDI